MEHEGLTLQKLLQYARPRQDIIPFGAPGSDQPTATYLGRVVHPGQSLQDVLTRSPLGELESGGLATQAPQLLQSAASLGKSLYLAGMPQLSKAVADRIKESVLKKPVYHGTPRAFGEFSMEKAQPGLYGKGIYFTENPVIAGSGPETGRGYAYNRTSLAPHEQWRPNIRPAFLNVKKPFDAEAIYSNDELMRIVSTIEKVPIKATQPQRSLKGEVAYEWLKNNLGGVESANLALKKAGYDSITHIGGKISGGEPHRVWIVFDPKQVVSAFERPQSLEQMLGPDAMRALTTPGKSEFEITLPRKK